MLNNRKLRKMLILAIITILTLALIITKIILPSRTPVKHAIHMEDIHNYANSIIVRQTWHTGTGWEKVGDEHGLYDSYRMIYDVKLDGNIPHIIGMGGDHVNVYLCIVIRTGTYSFSGVDVLTSENDPVFERYEVIDWYPIYPVKRDTILPAWFFSNDYLSKYDLHLNP